MRVGSSPGPDGFGPIILVNSKMEPLRPFHSDFTLLAVRLDDLTVKNCLAFPILRYLNVTGLHRVKKAFFRCWAGTPRLDLGLTTFLGPRNTQTCLSRTMWQAARPGGAVRRPGRRGPGAAHPRGGGWAGPTHSHCFFVLFFLPFRFFVLFFFLRFSKTDSF